MPFSYTVPQAVADATARQLNAAAVTQVLGDATKRASHADAHMRADSILPDPPDAHLKAAYAKRQNHSMFDSPLSAVEAITAALNTNIGVMALTDLMGQNEGIDLYSRTAVATLGGTKQFTRMNAANIAAYKATFAKGDAEYIVVNLRKNGFDLMIASAYPVISDAASRADHAGNDWFRRDKTKAVVHEFPKVGNIIVPW